MKKISTSPALPSEEFFSAEPESSADMQPLHHKILHKQETRHRRDYSTQTTISMHRQSSSHT